MEKRKYKVGIVTLSDKGSRGEREDLSGPKIQELLPDDRYEVVSYRILPDDQPAIEKELCRLADEEHCALVLTTGGTGFSVRDVTPEATLAVADRVVPGIAEAIRATKNLPGRAFSREILCVQEVSNRLLHASACITGSLAHLFFLSFDHFLDHIATDRSVLL